MAGCQKVINRGTLTVSNRPAISSSLLVIRHWARPEAFRLPMVMVHTPWARARAFELSWPRARPALAANARKLLAGSTKAGKSPRARKTFGSCPAGIHSSKRSGALLPILIPVTPFRGRRCRPKLSMLKAAATVSYCPGKPMKPAIPISRVLRSIAHVARKTARMS